MNFFRNKIQTHTHWRFGWPTMHKQTRRLWIRIDTSVCVAGNNSPIHNVQKQKWKRKKSKKRFVRETGVFMSTRSCCEWLMCPIQIRCFPLCILRCGRWLFFGFSMLKLFSIEDHRLYLVAFALTACTHTRPISSSFFLTLFFSRSTRLLAHSLMHEAITLPQNISLRFYCKICLYDTQQQHMFVRRRKKLERKCWFCIRNNIGVCVRVWCHVSNLMEWECLKCPFGIRSVSIFEFKHTDTRTQPTLVACTPATADISYSVWSAHYFGIDKTSLFSFGVRNNLNLTWEFLSVIGSTKFKVNRRIQKIRPNKVYVVIGGGLIRPINHLQQLNEFSQEKN